MKRFLLIILGIIMMGIGGLLAAPLFINVDGYKNKLTDTIKALTGLDPTISGEISVSFFPRPAVYVSNLSVPNIKGAASPSIISVQQIEVESSYQALFAGDVDIRSITLVHPTLELEKLDSGEKNWNILSKALDGSADKHNLTLPRTVRIVNGTIAYRTNNNRMSTDSITSNITIGSVEGPFTLQGKFQEEIGIIQYKATIGKRQDNFKTEINVSASSFEMVFNGAYPKEETKDPHLSGKLELSIGNVGQFVESFFPSSTFISRINSQEKLKLTSDIGISKHTVNLDNLVINSDSLVGKGSIEALAGKTEGWENPSWDIKVAMDKVNMDTLVVEKEDSKLKPNQASNANQFVDYYAYTLKSTKLSDYHFELPQNLNAMLQISAKDVVYNKGSMQDLSIDADIFSRKAAIHSLSASLPGESKIEFSGDVVHNGIRPLMTGSLNIAGNRFRSLLVWLWPNFSFVPINQMGEFRIGSNITMTPQKISFSDVTMYMDKTLVSGTVDMRPADAVPVVKTTIKLDRFDFDRYDMTKQIDQWAKGVIPTVKDVDLDTSWLHTLNLDLSMTLDATDLVYNKHPISTTNVVLSYKPGMLLVHRLILRSDVTDITSKFTVDIAHDQPALNLEMASKVFDTDLFLVKDAKAPPKLGVWSWSKEPFNFLGLQKFSGSIKFLIEHFKNDKLELKNLKSEGTLDKEVYSIKKLEADIVHKSMNGQEPPPNLTGAPEAVFQGSIGISESPAMSLSYGFSNMDLATLIDVFGVESPVSQGNIKLQGTASAYGKSPDEWISTLRLGAKVEGSMIVVEGFNLDSLVLSAPKLFSAIDLAPIVKQSMAGGRLGITTLQGSIIAQGPVMQAKDFQFATNLSRGAFAGNINLRNFVMRGVTKFSFAPEMNKAVNLSLELDGPLTNLNKKLDTVQLEQYITDKSQTKH